MHRQNRIIVTLMSGLFLFISAPISNADGEGVVGGGVVTTSTVSSLLDDNSGITILTGTLDTDPGVSTFTSFDPAITSEFVENPDLYVVNSSGILLEAAGSYQDNSDYASALTTILTDNNVTSFGGYQTPVVVDVGALSFDFTAAAGHNTVSIDFILASGEYSGGDWDIAGIFINGTNYAFLPNDNVLRVNSGAQITNVCSYGRASGCYISNYTIDGDILGTLSPNLTLYAPINADSINTFSASVANTDDDILPSYLLLSNFHSFIASDITVSTFTLVEEVLNFGIQLEDANVTTPLPEFKPVANQSSEITGISVSAADTNNNVTIVVTGKFIETVLAVDVNGSRVSNGAWKQTSASITLTVPAVASGIYSVGIWNGSLPALHCQTVVVTTK
jgi:hypothetical protein